MCTLEEKIFIFLCSKNFKSFIQTKNYINISVSNFIITARGGQFNYLPWAQGTQPRHCAQLGICVTFCHFQPKVTQSQTSIAVSNQRKRPAMCKILLLLSSILCILGHCKMSMNIGLYRIFFSSQQSEILPRRKEMSMYNIVYTNPIS